MSEKDFKNADLSEIIEKLQVGMSFTTKFDGKSIEALCLDVTDEGKIVMLFPEIHAVFDSKGSNNWRDSSIRMELNSDVFMCQLDKDFINHTVLKEVHTCYYITRDRFWLLSHEEIGFNKKSLKKNQSCKKLKYFDGSIKSRCFDIMLCSTHTWWWLRSADSSYGDFVGCVRYDGLVSRDGVGYYSAILPVCLIR